MAWMDLCLQRAKSASGDLVVRLGAPGRRWLRGKPCENFAASRRPTCRRLCWRRMAARWQRRASGWVPVIRPFGHTDLRV